MGAGKLQDGQTVPSVDNVVIGRSAGGNDIGNRNVFIGKEAGYFEAGDDKLYIDNSPTTQPLIFGDFVANQLRVNGNQEIATNFTIPNPTFRITNSIGFFGHYTVGGGSFNPANAGNVSQSLVFSTDGNSAVASGGLSIIPWGTTAGGIFIKEDGNVGIAIDNPTFKFQVNGTTACTGNVWTSDYRKKQHIKVLDLNCIEIVKQLKPVTYEWNTVLDNGMKGKQIGFIAQDLEKIIPTMVVTSEDNEQSKSVKYIELLPILTKAIQEQQNTLEEYKREIDQLKSEITVLKEKK